MTEKTFSKEFQNELLELMKMCSENHADGLTLMFEYPRVKVAIEMTFKLEKVAE